MVKGTLSFFHNRKGYGFIEIEGQEDEEDVFLHKSELSPGTRIEEGAEFEFEVEQAERGPRAVEVEKIE